MNIDSDDLKAACYSISVKQFILMFFFEDTLFIEESLIAPGMSFIYTIVHTWHVFFSVLVTFNPPRRSLNCVSKPKGKLVVCALQNTCSMNLYYFRLSALVAQ